MEHFIKRVKCRNFYGKKVWRVDIRMKSTVAHDFKVL